MRLITKTSKGDLSENKQDFLPLKLKLWCCRYWQLQRWNCRNHAFPYWRLYWNKNRGGFLNFRDKEIVMQPSEAYLIPPNTYFSSYIGASRNNFVDYEVFGKPIDEYDNEYEIANHSLLHLYIHFNLGVPYDFVKSDIYVVSLNSFQISKMNKLVQDFCKDKSLSVVVNLQIQSVVMEILAQSSINFHGLSDMDKRILTVIQHIVQHIDKNHTNDQLANMVNMAPNSFARLFKQNMKQSVQHFIKEQKIKTATSLFDHDDCSIEEVAYRLGFSDRYHFSRIFKKIKGLSPGKYMRKE